MWDKSSFRLIKIHVTTNFILYTLLILTPGKYQNDFGVFGKPVQIPFLKNVYFCYPVANSFRVMMIGILKCEDRSKSIQLQTSFQGNNFTKTNITCDRLLKAAREKVCEYHLVHGIHQVKSCSLGVL